MRILVWFRNDLRLHDHEPLHQALKQGAEIIPVYCFDPRQFGQTSFGFPKTGVFRAQFLRESVIDLKLSLQAKGSDLIIRHGKPDVEIPVLAQSLQIDTVYWHQEVTSEELAVDSHLIDQLNQIKVNHSVFWGATLYHPRNLPFTIEQLPPVFSHFRKKVEANSRPEPTLPTPQQLPAVPTLELGQVPTLNQLGVSSMRTHVHDTIAWKGGETAAFARIQHYVWDTDRLSIYKETRNGLIGRDYSSKYSPWLALGCISPRQIYTDIQRYETERVRNDSTYWLVFELLWRDYFRFVCAKHGPQVFYPSGLRNLPIRWKQDWHRFKLWTQGQTGFPLIDANMRELASTGFMSNRGRQNVASFLTKNLGIDWRMGAEWFESWLIDYDVCSNWGNWNYSAGVGNDARGFRYFNIPKQAKQYDPDGEYVKYWLPELSPLPNDNIHTPWQLNTEEQKRCGFRLGRDYPAPIVDLDKSVSIHEKIYNAALNTR